MEEKQLTNQFLIEAIEAAKTVYPKAETNFESFNGLILLVDRISNIKPCPFKRTILLDFVEGIAEYPDEKYKELIAPSFNRIVDYLKNSDYQAHLIERRINGKDIIHLYNMTMPVTAENIIEHIKENNMSVIIPKDVDIAKLDYLKYWNELSGIKPNANNKGDETVKSKWVVPVFALFLHYLMSGKYEKFTRNIEDIKNLCKKYEYYKSALNIQKTIQAIGTNKGKDPMKKDNIKKVIDILDEKKHPISINLATNDYVSTKAI